ncbi:hypothetical protein GCM10010295_43700 [Streptomyces intermedius]
MLSEPARRARRTSLSLYPGVENSRPLSRASACRVSFRCRARTPCGIRPPSRPGRTPTRYPRDRALPGAGAGDALPQVIAARVPAAPAFSRRPREPRSKK